MLWVWLEDNLIKLLKCTIAFTCQCMFRIHLNFLGVLDDLQAAASDNFRMSYRRHKNWVVRLWFVIIFFCLKILLHLSESWVSKEDERFHFSLNSLSFEENWKRRKTIDKAIFYKIDFFGNEVYYTFLSNFFA